MFHSFVRPVALAAGLFLCLAIPNGRAEHPELQYQRWSGEINVPDPVAVSVADNGDVYVTQTQRRKIQDLDIRAHSDWIADDVGFANVDQKRSFYHRVLAVGGDQTIQRDQVQDVNGDGQHDWRDLTVLSERIYRLVDSDGDGVADKINLFADNFRTEVTGIAAGLLHHDGSVWATIAPDVWKLTDTDGDGFSDSRQVMATGFGLHIAYAGHDMHGLTIGPDGKVYWTIGDKGIHVDAADGKTYHYPNQGGVLRCNVDGSGFEVFAHGLRNVQEIAFDQWGNLFGVDNDADQPDEKERFVWIVDQMDAGWRCNYQYRKGLYNPWTDERLWQTAGEDHPAFIVPPISHYHDGPAGFAFNPGAALSAAYRDYFFMTSAPNGFQYAFRTRPRGDSFVMEDSHLIGSGDPIVGIAFAPDGGLYGVDWGGGYPLTQSGAVIRIDVPSDKLTKDDQIKRRAVRGLLKNGFTNQKDDFLAEMLSFPDQRIRLRAQLELVRRKLKEPFVTALDHFMPLTRVHAIWGLGQLIRSGDAEPDVLYSALADEEWRVRVAAAKTLGETQVADPAVFVPLLGDAHPHVRVHAALALARRPAPSARDALVECTKELAAGEHYLRHAYVSALSACATPEELARLADSPNDQTRLIGLLALRRTGDRRVAAWLNDPSPMIATEAARAIHDDLSIAEALDELAVALEQERETTRAMIVRSINANFRLGSASHAERVMTFAADKSRPVAWRVIACEALSQWLEPPVLDRVEGRYRLLDSDRAMNRDAVGTLMANLVRREVTPLRIAALKASRKLGTKMDDEALRQLVRDRNAPAELRAEVLNALEDCDAELLVELSGDDSKSVATRSVERLVQEHSQAFTRQVPQLMQSDHLSVRQTCVEGLAKVSNPETDRALRRLADAFSAEQLSPALRLDVWLAVKERGDPFADERAKIEGIAPAAGSEDEALRAFAWCDEGGDPLRGESIFRSDLRAQCIRCHRIGKKGSNIGPELTKIAGKRDTAHLLRSIVHPSKDIEPKYNTQTLLLADGTVLQGVIVRENEKTTVLINSKAKEVSIPTDDIEDVAEKKVSLMPVMTDVLKPTEVRDLVAFLKTLR